MLGHLSWHGLVCVEANILDPGTDLSRLIWRCGRLGVHLGFLSIGKFTGKVVDLDDCNLSG